MMNPYIGVCDSPNGEQTLRWAELFERLCEKHGVHERKLMIGIMTSFKTQMGMVSKWTDVFPKKENYSDIFRKHHMTINTLHYADFAGVTSVKNLLDAVNPCGKFLDAIQLDMIWPRPQMLRTFRKMKPDIKVVLQINRMAMEETLCNPELVALRLKVYGDDVDYVLLDRSHGTGEGMRVDLLIPYARAIANTLPKMRLAGAGGLGPKTVQLVAPLVKEIPDFSWDAQGKLRPSGSSLDPINEEFANEYIEESIKLISK